MVSLRDLLSLTVRARRSSYSRRSPGEGTCGTPAARPAFRVGGHRPTCSRAAAAIAAAAAAASRYRSPRERGAGASSSIPAALAGLRRCRLGHRRPGLRRAVREDVLFVEIQRVADRNLPVHRFGRPFVAVDFSRERAVDLFADRTDVNASVAEHEDGVLGFMQRGLRVCSANHTLRADRWRSRGTQRESGG